MPCFFYTFRESHVACQYLSRQMSQHRHRFHRLVTITLPVTVGLWELLLTFGDGGQLDVEAVDNKLQLTRSSRVGEKANVRSTMLWSSFSAITLCEEKGKSFEVQTVTWYRRLLYNLRITSSLPLPRLVTLHDLTMDKRYIQQRQRDEKRVHMLQKEVLQAMQQNDKACVGRLLQETFAVLYGPGVTPAERQSFVEQHGCTGWTEDILITMLHLGSQLQKRGFVEIGAGNGQWARVLTDRYQESVEFEEDKKQKHSFEFVLAFDNLSNLPLKRDVYHERTKPYHDYFYHNVQFSDSIETCLSSWRCRGRILLLVYPPPGDMAITALQTYVDISPSNDTVVYVGEGRGGANANEAFFCALASGAWILTHQCPVKRFGTKGYENFYVFKRRTI